MQLNSVGKEKQDRFKNYMEKTYKKTASLMANSCKAVSNILTVCLSVCLSIEVLFCHCMATEKWDLACSETSTYPLQN